MTKHQCPICKREVECSDPNCDDSRYVLCESCWIFVAAEKAKKQMNKMVEEFKKNPKKYEQNLPSFKDTTPKGKRRTEIPNKSIPSLVRTIFQNSIRLRKDANILFNAKSCESSIIKLFETSEELAKIIMLLKCYKKQENVSKDEVKEIFRNHQHRLQEFARYFHDSLFGKSKDDALEYDEWYFGYAGHYDQDVKEQLTYVDWVDGQIHNPLDMPEIAKKGKDAVKNAHETHFRNKAFEVDTVINYLQKDSDFQKIINES